MQPAIFSVEKVDWVCGWQKKAKNNKFRKTDNLILPEWHTKVGGAYDETYNLETSRLVISERKNKDNVKVATFKTVTCYGINIFFLNGI